MKIDYVAAFKHKIPLFRSIFVIASGINRASLAEYNEKHVFEVEGALVTYLLLSMLSFDEIELEYLSYFT